MKEKVKELWKVCFNDTDEFINLYFSKRYKEDINMAIQEGDKVIAALQMIQYPMTSCGHITSTSYISGACTHPEYRNKGIMSELLHKTLLEMKSQEVTLSTLIPAEEWLIDYYRKFGYENVFNYSTNLIDIDSLQISGKYRIESFNGQPEEIYPYFSSRMEERSCCVQHAFDDFTLIVEDIKINGGKILVAYKEQTIAGLAFCYLAEPDYNKIIIKELFAENQEIEDSLLHAAAAITGQKNIERITLPTGGSPSRLGMARIINAENMLKQYILKHDSLIVNIRLSDNILKANEGYYHISKGELRKTFSPEDVLYQDMTINELAKLMIEFKPYMSLMLD